MAQPRIAALALLLLFLAACATPLPVDLPLPLPPPPVHFIAFGDAGTGSVDQHKVAKAMETVCIARGCDFGVELGDNIYPAGASSPEDPQFVTKFEEPYANLTFPIWLVLGNHDNADPTGNPAAGLGAWYETGNHQVAYSHRTDRMSERWQMPARFYNFTAGSGSTSVDFLALDTNTLVYEDLPFPPDLDTRIREQTEWVDGAVAAADSTWRIAFGHHPYISNGPHGNAGSYDGRPGVPGVSGDYLKEFFEAHLCGKVDLYLSGHDHDLEWLQAVPSCGTTQFIVSGGGGAGTYPLQGTNQARFQVQSLGFWWFEADGKVLRVAAFDSDGTVLHEGTLAPSRPA